MKAVAIVLNVDEGWLSLGIVPEMTQRERKSVDTLLKEARSLSQVSSRFQADIQHSRS